MTVEHLEPTGEIGYENGPSREQCVERVTALVVVRHEELIVSEARRPDQHPASVYLAHLARGSRRTMRQALDTIAAVLTEQHCNAETLGWALVRYQHTAAV